ncbi:MAG TPA: hypothetical protein VFZ93_03315, partial [Albitalea sp.]
MNTLHVEPTTRSHPPPHPHPSIRKASAMSASFKSHAARAVIFIASFASASAVMVAVGGAFHN